jgi:hypothetical protein
MRACHTLSGELATVLRAHHFSTFGTIIDFLDPCSAFFAFLVSLFVPPSLPVQIFLYVSDTVLLDNYFDYI